LNSNRGEVNRQYYPTEQLWQRERRENENRPHNITYTQAGVSWFRAS